MNFEDFLCIIYTPLKSIETLTDLIYYKCNEEWNLFDTNVKRDDIEELLGINYSIKLCTKELLKLRKNQINNFYKNK